MNTITSLTRGIFHGVAQTQPWASPQPAPLIHAEDWTLWIPAWGIALTLLAIALGFRRKKHLIEDLPTSKVEGVFIGLVEVKGQAEAEQPLRSFLAETPAVHYRYRVEEHWRRVETETYRDKDGKTRTRTRVRSGWTTVDRAEHMIPFYLRDDTGILLIWPRGAKIEPVSIFSQTVSRGHPLYHGKGPRRGIPDSTGRRRFSEEAIPLHRPLYIVGKARERSDIVAPEIRHDKDADMYLISTRSEEEVHAGFGFAYAGLSFLGLAALIGIQMALRHHLHPEAAGLNPAMGGMVGGYALCWALGWFWMTYNSLVELRQRVKRGWSLVDIELKRRADLLPGLIQVLEGLRRHEREVLELLARLRAQAGATEPGEPGPDPAGCAAGLRIVMEKHPELSAQKSFERLRRDLIQTEQRIALTRGYFNEICTHYNTRIQVVPGNWIAKIGKMVPHPLISAREFERAPVAVRFEDTEDAPPP